jgi:phosphatidate cytidylyltransferase
MKPLLTAAALLAATAWPVLASKSTVLRGRWITWAGLTAAFAIASIWGNVGVGILFGLMGIVCWIEGQGLQELAKPFLSRKSIAVFAYRGLMAGASVLLLMQTLVTSVDFMLSLVVIVALFDIGGWVGGKLLTRLKPLDKKLFPTISPNKTWGGLVGSVLLGFAANLWFGTFSDGAYILVAAGAVAGDWLESWIKRIVGVKDASNWLPGFGGLLDRVDSLLPMGLVLLVIGF